MKIPYSEIDFALYHAIISYIYFYTTKASLVDYEIHVPYFVNRSGEFV